MLFRPRGQPCIVSCIFSLFIVHDRFWKFRRYRWYRFNFFFPLLTCLNFLTRCWKFYSALWKNMAVPRRSYHTPRTLTLLNMASPTTIAINVDLKYDILQHTMNALCVAKSLLDILERPITTKQCLRVFVKNVTVRRGRKNWIWRKQQSTMYDFFW